MQDKNEMTWIGHLEELRKRIILILLVLLLSLIAGLFAADPILSYLKHTPPASEVQWHAFSPWDGINIYMKFGFIVALTVSLPFTLYQIWRFVSPGLTRAEQKATLRYIPGAVVLFLIGLAFAYWIVFPMAFYFSTKVTHSIGLTQTYGISQYFSFMFNIIVPMSLMFELPMVVLFLTKLRILNPLRLRRMRRYAYMLLVIVSTIITPPDMISDILVAIPLIALYEFSVLLSSIVYRKRLAADKDTDAGM